jgi:hypothetical protein
MKATTYISNTFYNKVNMKNFYLKKYIYILSIFLVSWFGVENAIGQSLSTIYSTSIIASPSGATRSSSSLSFTTSTPLSWDVTTPGDYGKSSGSGSYTLTYGTALALGTNGSNNGTITIRWGDSGNNSTLSVQLNGGSTIQIDAITTSTDRSKLRTATYNIPTTTTSLSSIKISLSKSTEYIFDLNIQSYSSCTAPTITTQPSTTSSTYCVGGTATALSVATSATSPTYQWYSSALGGTTDTVAISGATSASYTPTTTAASTSYYLCKVTSGGCSAMSTASGLITINALPTITLGSMPSVISGTTSANLTYSATTGSPNQYSITWNSTATSAGFSNVTNATLSSSPIVLAVPAAAAGTYTGTLTVTNSTTGCISPSYTITVSISSNAVTTSAITGSPFCAGATASVGFTSTGTFTSGNVYTAQLSDASGSFSSPTTIGSVTSTANSGTITATLPTNPTAGTAYRIRVIASNPATTGTDNGTNLTVNAATTITTQPSNTSATVGGTAALTVAATGTGTLTYQWYSNNSNPSNSGGTSLGTSAQTASYNASTATTGTTYYYCIVTGSCGSVTTNAVSVTVTAVSGSVPVPSAPTNGCNTLNWTCSDASTANYDVKICTSTATELSVTPSSWTTLPTGTNNFTAINYGFNTSTPKLYLGCSSNKAGTGAVDVTAAQGYLQFDLPNGAKTLTVDFTKIITVQCSTDGGASWPDLATAVSTSPLTVNINNGNAVKIRIVNGGTATGNWAYITAISTTNYSGCTSYNTASTAKSYTPTGLSSNTTYYASIKNNESGSSSLWSPVLTYLTSPDAPTALTANNATSGQLALSWTAPSNATGVTYTVEYKKSSDPTWISLATGITGTTATITGLSALTPYDYQVKSVNSACSSAWVAGSASTIDTPPAIPAPTPNTPTTSGFNLTWPAVTGAEGYEVELCKGDPNLTTYALQTTISTANGWTDVPSGISAASCNNLGAMIYGSASAFSQNSYDFTYLTATSGGSSCGGRVSTSCGCLFSRFGEIILPQVISAGTLTFKAGAYSAGGRIIISKSVNGGAYQIIDTAICANAYNLDASLSLISVKVNELEPVRIKLYAIDGSIVVKDISVTNYRDCSTIDQVTTNSKTYTTLDPNTKYLYSVRSYKTSGGSKLYSDWSTINATTKQVTLPLPPTCVAPTTSDVVSGFNAKWSAPSTIGSEAYTYRVQLLDNSNNTIGSAVSVPSTATSYNFDASVTKPNTTYKYVISTVNQGGSSSTVTCSSITTPDTIQIRLRILPAGSGSIVVGNNTISTNTTISVNKGNTISLSATPTSGYGFLRWILGKQTLSTDYPLNITINSDTIITAMFGAETCTTYPLTSSIPTGWVASGSTSPSISSSSLRFNYNGGIMTLPVTTNNITSISFQAKTNSSYSSSDTRSTDFAAYLLTSDGSTMQVFYKNFARSVNADATLATYTINGLTAYGKNVQLQLKSIKKDGGSSSNDILITNLTICLGPETTPPVIKFVPTPSSTNVPVTKILTIKSTEVLYQYQSDGTVAAVSNLTTLANNGDLTLEKLALVSGTYQYVSVPFSATLISGDSIRVTPTATMDYDTQYKLTIKNVCDANGNMIDNYSQKTTFTTEKKPTPLIKVEEVSTTSGGNTSATVKTYSTGGTANMGTVITDGVTVTKKFRITNQGNGTLTLNGLVLATSDGIYTVSGATDKSGASISSLSATDTAYFNVTYAPGTTTMTNTNTLNITTNDANLCPSVSSCNPFVLNLTGSKAQFVLPYTYESGCTTPIASTTELKQDYSSSIDIPSAIILTGAAKLVPSYNVYQSEGACEPNGNSALRIGSTKNRLQVTISNGQGVGQVDIKWCASGYRKVKIYTAANTYVQSSSFLPGGVCYSNSTVMNLTGNPTFYIEFDGNSDDVLTTLYYLHITPYNAELKSSSRDIVSFNTGVTGENDRIYDNVIFVTYPNSYTGSLTTITPTIGLSSSTATVSPKSGVTNTSADSTYTYTVTAEDGQTKQYKVYVDKAPNYSGCYADSVTYTVPMNSTNQILQVLEISNSTGCVVPVSGNGSSYTIYYLTPTLHPSGTHYKIDGPTLVCIGSQSTYKLINAPSSNKQTYSWKINDPDSVGFTMISKPTDKELKLQAPKKLNSSGAISLEIKINMTYTGSCSFLDDTTSLNIKATKDAPTAIKGITTGCVSNGKLTVKAYGAAGASSYNWDFIPSSINKNVITQGSDSIVLNLGSYTSNLYAAVNAQNGCGVTNAQDSIQVNYGTSQTTWTGKYSPDWNDSRNWTCQVPKSCTNVIIPDIQAVPYYPTINRNTNGECNYIIFQPGAGVLYLDSLSYNKAFVQLTLQRNKWYTLTAPLKNMYSGDYYFNAGAPVTYMRLFDAVNPDSAGITTHTYTGTWTKTFATLKESLTPGEGFAYKIDNTVWNYPNGKTYTNTDKTLTFPRMNADSSLITKYIPYSASSGKSLTSLGIPITRNTYAYRLAMENNKNKLADQTISLKQGLNLIGNPMMTHLDITQLVTDNSSIISPIFRFWDGTNFVTYNSGSGFWSDASYNTGSLIAPMQSFIVDAATAGPLTFKLNSDFVADVAKTNKLRATTTKDNLMYITSSNGTTHSSTAITRNDKATNAYEANVDAFKLFTSITDVPDIYTMTDNVRLAINQFKDVPYTTPLAIKTTQYGKTTLTFNGAESFGDDVAVSLINTATNENINLKEQPTYTFTLDSTNAEGTLFVQFKDATITSSTAEQGTTASIQIYTKDNNVIRVISSPNDLIKSITIMDETGKKVVEKSDLSTSLFDMVMNNGEHVYIVRAVTEKEVKIAKVLIK